MTAIETNLGGPDFAYTLIPSISSCNTEGLESLERPFIVCNFTGCFVNVRCRKGKVRACGLSLEIGTLSSKININPIFQGRVTTHSRVTLLGLLSIPRENDQLGLVGLQPLDI
jgi:hypothetical protein